LLNESGDTSYYFVSANDGEMLTLTLLPNTNVSGSLNITLTVSDGIVDVYEQFILTIPNSRDTLLNYFKLKFH